MGERVDLDTLGQIRLSDFKSAIKDSRESGRLRMMEFRLCGLSYRAVFSPDGSILINWRREGKEYVERINLAEAKSNLNLSPVLYFVCPYSGRRCRKLFTDGYKLFSMNALSHGYTYATRNESKKFRRLRKLIEAPPDTARRKLHYRGKLTPFGKKVAKYNKRVEELNMHEETEASLLVECICKRRGRPAGSRNKEKKNRIGKRFPRRFNK